MQKQTIAFLRVLKTFWHMHVFLSDSYNPAYTLSPQLNTISFSINHQTRCSFHRQWNPACRITPEIWFDVDGLSQGRKKKKNVRHENRKGAQIHPVLFLDDLLRHIGERTALIITFISPSEQTGTAELMQRHGGRNSATASGSPKRLLGSISLSHTHRCTCTQEEEINKHKQSV